MIVLLKNYMEKLYAQHPSWIMQSQRVQGGGEVDKYQFVKVKL